MVSRGGPIGRSRAGITVLELRYRVITRRNHHQYPNRQVTRQACQSVTINKGITWDKQSWAERTNKNAAHVDPREVVRPRIADEGPKDPLRNKERLEYIR